MRTKSDNREIMTGSETDELFEQNKKTFLNLSGKDIKKDQKNQ